jgi:hypothetical protein
LDALRYCPFHSGFVAGLHEILAINEVLIRGAVLALLAARQRSA